MQDYYYQLQHSQYVDVLTHDDCIFKQLASNSTFILISATHLYSFVTPFYGLVQSKPS